MAAKPRVKVPKKAAVGDIIKIKSLVSHATVSYTHLTLPTNREV